MIADFYISHEHNRFFNNTFNNPSSVDAVDNGTDNYWDNSTIGNYWHEYTGLDTDDDGIGETPYDVAGTAVGSIDNYPLFWDAPKISLISPDANFLFGPQSPDFEIQIIEGVAASMWYRLNNSTVQSGNITFTQVTGVIDQSEWDKLGNGTVTITFSANDSRGWTNSSSVTVRKNTFIPVIDLISPASNAYLNGEPHDFTVSIGGSNLDSRWYSLDNGTKSYNYTFTGTSGTFNQAAWESFGDGPIIIKFYLNNTLGVENSDEITVIKDTIDPSVTVSMPITNSIYGTIAPEFDVRIIDAVLESMWYVVNNNVSGMIPFLINGSISQGLWNAQGNGTVTITFYGRDAANNVGNRTILVRKDVIAPPITITKPLLNAVFVDVPLFEISVNDAQFDSAWYTIEKDSITYLVHISSTTGSINSGLWNSLTLGNITLRFYANDTLGNVGFSEVFITKGEQVPPPDYTPVYVTVGIVIAAVFAAVIIVYWAKKKGIIKTKKGRVFIENTKVKSEQKGDDKSQIAPNNQKLPLNEKPAASKDQKPALDENPEDKKQKKRNRL